MYTYVICYENIADPTKLVETTVHELLHIFDFCSGCPVPTPGEKLDCSKTACTEVRAYSISGTCLADGFLRKYLISKLGHCTYEECVKAGAIGSLITTPDCKDGAEQYVNKIYENCKVEESKLKGPPTVIPVFPWNPPKPVQEKPLSQ